MSFTFGSFTPSELPYTKESAEPQLTNVNLVPSSLYTTEKDLIDENINTLMERPIEVRESIHTHDSEWPSLDAATTTTRRRSGRGRKTRDFGTRDNFIHPLRDPVPKELREDFLSRKVNLGWRNIGVPRGLVNEGNTCFLNSVLQVMVGCPPWVNAMLDPILNEFPPSSLTSSFCTFLKEYHSEHGKHSSPLRPSIYFTHALTNFREAISSTPLINKQEDAHEFFTWLIDAMHQECAVRDLRDATMEAVSINSQDQWQKDTVEESGVSRVFGSLLHSQLKSRGTKASITPELCYCLPLDIQPRYVTTVEDALAAFTEPEKLVDWGTHASKGYKFENLPPVLALYLKRFFYHDETKRTMKITKHVSYPKELSLPKSVYSGQYAAAEGNKYTLFAIISHHGTSAVSGHYTCDRRKADGQWITLDDSMVYPTHTDQIFKRNPYLLFYLKKRHPFTKKKKYK